MKRISAKSRQRGGSRDHSPPAAARTRPTARSVAPWALGAWAAPAPPGGWQGGPRGPIFRVLPWRSWVGNLQASADPWAGHNITYAANANLVVAIVGGESAGGVTMDGMTLGGVAMILLFGTNANDGNNIPTHNFANTDFSDGSADSGQSGVGSRTALANRMLIARSRSLPKTARSPNWVKPPRRYAELLEARETTSSQSENNPPVPAKTGRPPRAWGDAFKCFSLQHLLGPPPARVGRRNGAPCGYDCRMAAPRARGATVMSGAATLPDLDRIPPRARGGRRAQQPQDAVLETSRPAREGATRGACPRLGRAGLLKSAIMRISTMPQHPARPRA